MRQNCCDSLAKKWEIAGIKAVQLSCVYGVPIISDSGRMKFFNTQLHYKDTEKVLVLLYI